MNGNPMTQEEIKKFIMEEGERAEQITNDIRAHLTHLLESTLFVCLVDDSDWLRPYSHAMPDSDDFQIPPAQEQLHEILMKIVTYQHSLPDGRSVQLEELRREGVLTATDADFLTTHSVTYTPHPLSDYHAIDMLHMPTDDDGCAFIGPCGPPLMRQRAPLRVFEPIVESFLRLPKPQEELLLHIEFTEQDGMGVARR